MIHEPPRSATRLTTVVAVPLLIVGLTAGLAACGGGSAAAPTGYARPTTTFTTEPVRTTLPPTTTLAPSSAGTPGAGSDTAPGVPDGVLVDPLTGRWTSEIVRGDNPSKLARRFGVTVEELAAANADTPDYESFLIGAIVVVPNPALEPSTDPGPEPTQDSPEDTCSDGRRAATHVIVRGDNPSKLASRYGVTVEELAAANADTPGYSSYLLGTRVVIPC